MLLLIICEENCTQQICCNDFQTFKMQQGLKTVSTSCSFTMWFYVQLPRLKQGTIKVVSGVMQSSGDHAWPSLRRSLTIARQQRAVASSRPYGSSQRCCSWQDLMFLFTSVESEPLYWFTRDFSPVKSAWVQGFFPPFLSSWGYRYLFIFRFMVRFLQSPFTIAYYYHLFMLMLSLAACICAPLFIFLSPDLWRSLASHSQITFCLLSTPDDPFITQLCFTISSDNASHFLAVP